MEPFEIDADVSRARSLPPEWYVAPEALARERRGVFARTWQLAARAQELAQVGDYVASEVAGEPVLIVRAAEGDGGLRAWSNVCPHRAGPLASGSGKRRTIQCGYHGWTFDLEGKLLRAPEAEGRDLSDVSLAPLAVGVWGPLVFVALEPAASLAETFEHVTEPAREQAFVMARDYPVDAGWKVYVDNYLEGYHIPVVHPELFKELDYGNYRTVLASWSSRQFAPLRPVAARDSAAERVYAPEFEGEEAEYYWVFPNLMLNLYKGMLQTNVVLPIAPDRCVVRFEWFAAEPPADHARDPKWTRLVEMSDLLQAQDAKICSTVQRNLAARGARRGFYVPAREAGVHHFHRLLATTTPS
jgi:choline monooxygenase